MLKQPAIFVLASFKPSTGTRPPHISAARTNVVLLIRRTVRPKGYASGFHSLRPCWTDCLSILQGQFLFQPDSYSCKVASKTQLVRRVVLGPILDE
jgi:hypothetical protein